MTQDRVKPKINLEGPAIWTSPEPPADYTYRPIDVVALRALLQPNEVKSVQLPVKTSKECK